MLSKDKRLNLKTSFSFVAKGQRSENQIVKIFFRLGDNEKPLIGIALKTEYFKKAVDRNRARRLVSSGVEHLYERLKNKLNLVLMPKTKILEFNPKEIENILGRELEKLDLLIK